MPRVWWGEPGRWMKMAMGKTAKQNIGRSTPNGRGPEVALGWMGASCWGLGIR